MSMEDRIRFLIRQEIASVAHEDRVDAVHEEVHVLAARIIELQKRVAEIQDASQTRPNRSVRARKTTESDS